MAATQQFGAFGTAPSMGTAQYTTGIPQGPSTSPDQMKQLNAVWSGLGVGPQVNTPYAPSLAGQTNPAQQKSINDSLQMLQRQAGTQGSAQFQNMANKNEADLAYQQAQSNADVGNKMQGLLGQQYSDYLGRQSELNTAIVENQVRNQRLLAQLYGGLFGGMLGSLGGGLGNLIGGLGGGSSGGGSGSSPSFNNILGSLGGAQPGTLLG